MTLADHTVLYAQLQLNEAANTTPSRTETDSKKDLWVFVSYDGGTSWYGNIVFTILMPDL